jgi:two-component system, chemotaxis family, sensor kinase Cph1
MRILNDRIDIASSAAGVGIWDWDIKTGQLEWSPLMYDLFGLDPQKTEPSFEAWENTLHSEDLEKASKNIELTIKEHTYLDNEYRIVLSNGQIKWINALGQAEYDDQDRPQRMTGICIDVTERKLVEEELRESKEELAKLLDAVPVAVWIAHDPEGLHITGNKLSYEWLRLPQGVEASKSAPEKERPETFKMFKDGVEMVADEMPVQLSASGKELDDYEFDLVFSDGSERNMFGNSTPLYDDLGNPRGSVSAFLDITKHKQTEIKLKETLENLEDLVKERTRELLLANDYNRNLLETALDPLVTFGPDGKITDINRATENVTGYSREKLVGTDFSDYFTNPGDAKKGYQQVFRSGMVRDYPLEIKHKDGSITPVLYNASVYKDAFGETIGVFAAARDITELKKAQDELREYWENLEEQVKLRTEELAKSNADLEQFAYVASHDLREPLRMINSFLQLLERRYKSQLDDDAKEFIGFAVDGAKRLDKMIMDLLEYSQIANKEMMFSEVDFEKVIHQVKLNLNVRIHENNAEITCDQLPKNVRADINQMILLFQNLIGNAIKYRSDESLKIHISSFKEDDYYVFSVKDNGIGIDPKHLERIFTIFQRLHTHQEYEGSGIGLSIVQRIVHQHGGEIWVESEPGKGSTFQFTIKI